METGVYARFDPSEREATTSNQRSQNTVASGSCQRHLLTMYSLDSIPYYMRLANHPHVCRSVAERAPTGIGRAVLTENGRHSVVLGLTRVSPHGSDHATTKQISLPLHGPSTRAR